MLRRTLALVLTAVAALVFLHATTAPAAPPPVDPVPAMSASTAPEAIAAATSTPGPIPAGYRVKVPRLGIDLPIAEGSVSRDIAEQQTPVGYAFHLPGTSLPGQSGNCYLYAHARVGMFLPLWNARVGDDVLITTPDGRTLRFAVTQVLRAVPPDDVAVTEQTAGEQLTLQTSTGPVPQDPRFVVVAKPVA